MLQNEIDSFGRYLATNGKRINCPHQEEVCEWCEGTGEVATDEEDGEGHTMRGVGTRKCICQSSRPE